MTTITTTEAFVTKAKEVYGEKYDFTETKFVNMTTPVGIMCAPHGVFLRTPKIFLAGGHGCYKCELETKMPGMSKDEFLAKAGEMHGEKYKYDTMNYKGLDVEIEIERKGFGVFKQTPRSHLSRKGFYGTYVKKTVPVEMTVEGKAMEKTMEKAPEMITV